METPPKEAPRKSPLKPQSPARDKQRKRIPFLTGTLKSFRRVDSNRSLKAPCRGWGCELSVLKRCKASGLRFEGMTSTVKASARHGTAMKASWMSQDVDVNTTWHHFALLHYIKK